jgi:hypothetical protein
MQPLDPGEDDVMADVPKVLKTLYDDESLQNDCSGFFKAVAAKLGVPVPKLTADGLIDYISDPAKTDWIEIGKGADAGTKAAGFAKQGYLVVALLKAGEHKPFKLNPKTKKYDIPHPYHHGHLSIVLGSVDEDGYPYVVSGSIVPDGKSDGSKSVHGVWRGVDAPNVHYYRTGKTYSDLLPTRVPQ